MIAIDKILVSDEVVEEQFICDLRKCKGGCCEDGDTGAPLETSELKIINEVIEKILPYLPKESIDEISRQGRYVYDTEYEWVTPTINGKMCVYGFKDESGIIKCSFEQAYYNGETDFKKPISCHLFPVRITKGEGYENVNYEPRETLCKPACNLGKKQKVPVYQFLRESLERKYGKDFYEALDAVAKEYFGATDQLK